MCAAESSEQVIWKSSRGEVVGEMGLDSASRSGVGRYSGTWSWEPGVEIWAKDDLVDNVRSGTPGCVSSY